MDDEDLGYAGITGQRELLRSRAISARELLEAVLRNIERLEPQLRCFTKVYADRVLDEAAAVQRRLDAGDDAPLLGVPIAVKDLVDVEGEPTGWGTGAGGRVARADSEVVRRLRAAGAVIVGKTTLCELAMWDHFTGSRSWGATRNPWDVERTPGGSSGGSAVAVASGMVPGALASDGGGSIRVPAAFCGLFGLKPQRGRTTWSPRADDWFGLSVLGGLARDVRDTALLDDVIRGPSSGDRFVAPPPERSFTDAARSTPSPLRIAVGWKPAIPGVPLHASMRAAVEHAAEILRSLGHRVDDREPKLPDLRFFLPIVARYLAGVEEDARELEHPEQLERRSRRMVRLGRLLRDGMLERSLAREAELVADFEGVFRDHDVLLMPVVAQPPPRVGLLERRGALSTFALMSPYVSYTPAWNYTGQPAATVPIELGADGIPRAVQLVARPNDEATLFSLAAQMENVCRWTDWRPPARARTFDTPVA